MCDHYDHYFPEKKYKKEVNWKVPLLKKKTKDDRLLLELIKLREEVELIKNKIK